MICEAFTNPARIDYYLMGLFQKSHGLMASPETIQYAAQVVTDKLCVHVLWPKRNGLTSDYKRLFKDRMSGSSIKKALQGEGGVWCLKASPS